MKISIEPYNPNWKDAFEQERNAIAAALHQLSPVIEHIGSTSIEGLAAKPVIDILAGVKTESDLQRCLLPMQRAGYTYHKLYEPAMPYRRFFVRYTHPENYAPPEVLDKQESNPVDMGFSNTTHIHMIAYETFHWTRHIAFRDYLKAHPDVRKEYEALKHQLVKHDFQNSQEYSHAKNDFMQHIERKALKWIYGSKSAGANS